MKNLEIEKKYLVSSRLNLDTQIINKQKRITQGYIYIDKFTEVRVRSIETAEYKKFFYTVKTSEKSLLTRYENKFEISEELFNNLIENIKPGTSVISKDRYNIELANGLVAELDIFYGELEGLEMVEVEFTSEEEANSFVKPDWFGEDVTTYRQYKNKELAKYKRNTPNVLKKEMSKK